MSEVEQLAEEQFNTFRKRFCEIISEIAEEYRSAFMQGYAKGETDEKFRTKQVVTSHIADLEKENAELKKECRRCVHTDCPCILSDYGKDRNGICDHFIDVFDENIALKEQIEKMKKDLQEIKMSYENSKDKTPINAMGAEYRLLCAIENLMEEWEIKEK